MSTSPIATSQLTGSALSHGNCGCTTGTMCEQRHSVGRYRHVPDAIRAATGDTVGGTTYQENAAAVAKLTAGKVQLEPRFWLTRSNVRDYIAGGRGSGVAILCLVTVNTTRRTGSFTGRHSVYVNAYVWRAASSTICTCEKQTKLAHAEFDVCDPGKYLQANTKFQRWSADLLYRAAEAHGGGNSGDPVISMLLTADTEGITRTAIEAGSLFAATSTTATKVGTFPVGKSFAVTTLNGGGWKAPDGGTRKNWYRTKVGTAWAYVIGRALQ